MKSQKHILGICILIFLSIGIIAFKSVTSTINDSILSYTVDPLTEDLQLYWKNDNGIILKSIENLKTHVELHKKNLVFAMNGGMFSKDLSPQGLYIQNKKLLVPIDTADGNGNFYLKPNGVFYITSDHIASVCKTTDFINKPWIKYATQSGPMLVINGEIHSAFRQGSKNLNIRNGVGILPNNKVVFAMSKNPINFYDFAKYFQTLGCKNALYLDGYVSRTYLPEKNWMQLDGSFGVIIGVTQKHKK